jgi:hypothetical protein
VEITEKTQFPGLRFLRPGGIWRVAEAKEEEDPGEKTVVRRIKNGGVVSCDQSRSHNGILAKGAKFMTRIYVIHADEDYLSYDRLAAQTRTARLAVDFDHMPEKQTWVPHWKGNCRNRIYRCGGAIVLLSKNTARGGVGWELECAQACALPMLGLCVEGFKTPAIPEELSDWPVVDWNWPEIERFIQTLAKGTSANA